MNDYCQDILKDLNEEIDELLIEMGDTILFYEIAVGKVLRSLELTRQFVLQRGFLSQSDEIQFFKELKPKIVSKLIYYNAIYKIEAKKPYGGRQVIEAYLNRELLELKRFYDKNVEFYKYYRTNNSSLDEKMFVRNKHDLKLCLDTYYFQSDHSFSTSHDYKVAKIIANDLIQVYIEDQLYNKFQKDKSKAQKKLKWTGSKVALIELVYALHYQNVFDNGNNDIREVAQHRLF